MSINENSYFAQGGSGMKKQPTQMTQKPDSVWLGFDVKVEPGPVLKPYQIHFWKEADFKKAQPEAPFHYHSDALVGLAMTHLVPNMKNPFAAGKNAPKMNFPFCHEAWLAMEPHHELFNRSQQRVMALRTQMKPLSLAPVEYFERNFSEIFEESINPWGMDLSHLCHAIEAIQYLENKMDSPLLYNFNLKLSKPLVEKMHYLHSLLFNLRSLIALDFNAHVQDPTHEACKVDSITDYLSKAEYVANDAILYYNFKKQKDQMKPEAYETLEKTFKTYSHNGYCLIESLPKSFLKSLATAELEESLYIAQMDWLLGTDAGLLFRIREELYGLQEGYERIFWPDVSDRPVQNQSHLSASCELTVNDIYPAPQTKVA